LKTNTYENHNNLFLHIPQNYDPNYDHFILQPKIYDGNIHDNLEVKTLDDTSIAPEPSVMPPRQSTRYRRPPTYLEDFQTTNIMSSKYPINIFFLIMFYLLLEALFCLYPHMLNRKFTGKLPNMLVGHNP